MPTERAMKLTPEYEPLQPGEPIPPNVELLRTEWLAAPLRFRLFMTLYLVVAAWGGLVGGHLLTSAFSNWLTWSVTLLILEPVGVTAVAALIFLYWPNSWVAGLLGKALGRAKVATLIVGACVVGWFAWVIIYFGIEFWKLK
jgi:hypothetical protein